MRNSEGQLAIIALTVRGYENLALNISELERYIRQQKQVIVYYEDAIKPTENVDETNDNQKAAEEGK